MTKQVKSSQWLKFCHTVNPATVLWRWIEKRYAQWKWSFVSFIVIFVKLLTVLRLKIFSELSVTQDDPIVIAIQMLKYSTLWKLGRDFATINYTAWKMASAIMSNLVSLIAMRYRSRCYDVPGDTFDGNK